jgi:DmsE family decaheme c-type cytochrome
VQCHKTDPKRHWESTPDLLKSARCTDCHKAMKPHRAGAAGNAPLSDENQKLIATFVGQYAGEALCLTCHRKLRDHYEDTTHSHVLGANGRTELEKRGCEGCHGPGKVHAYSGGGKNIGGMITFRAKTTDAIRKENEACLECHERGERTYWEGSTHDMRTVACTSCHVVMEKRSAKALLSRATEPETCAKCHTDRKSQTFRNSHMPLREGKMACSSCHNPHGSATQSLLRGDSPNESCYTCHADKRGPFLWEHAPVVENCMNCHDPHGTPRPKLLKAIVPRLCQECHDETQHPTEARTAGNKFTIGRACLNCHTNIHGSNHPAGMNFTR